jgi:hypothetical protein
LGFPAPASHQEKPNMYITPFECGLIVGSAIGSLGMWVLDAYGEWKKYKIRNEEKDKSHE